MQALLRRLALFISILLLHTLPNISMVALAHIEGCDPDNQVCVHDPALDHDHEPVELMTPGPPVDTCPNLPGSIVVRGFRPFATQCQQVSEAGVGIPALIAQGIIDAVDIYNKVDAPLQVCFRQQGRLKFLDSATMPRAQSDLTAEYIEGMTCGQIDRIGTVVLLQGGETAAATIAETSDSPPVALATGPLAGERCQLVTTDNLSLRGGPSIFYGRIDIIPPRTRLTAKARNSGWFLVEFEALQGWVSGDYTTASAGCDGVSEGSVVFLQPQTSPLPTAASEDSPPMADPEEMEADAPETMAEAEQMEMPVPEARPLTNCDLRSGDIINLRQGPGLDYEIKAEIPYETSLSAMERAGDWFKVDYEMMTGWVNINYVFRNGACG